MRLRGILPRQFARIFCSNKQFDRRAIRCKPYCRDKPTSQENSFRRTDHTWRSLLTSSLESVDQQPPMHIASLRVTERGREGLLIHSVRSKSVRLAQTQILTCEFSAQN